jgi:hypothetical protein
VASVTDAPALTQPWPWIRFSCCRLSGSVDACKRISESDNAIFLRAITCRRRDMYVRVRQPQPKAKTIKISKGCNLYNQLH